MKTFRFQVLSPTWIMLVAADGSRTFFVVYLDYSLTHTRTHTHTVNVGTSPREGGMMMLYYTALVPSGHPKARYGGRVLPPSGNFSDLPCLAQRLLFFLSFFFSSPFALFLSHLTRFVLVCTVTNSTDRHARTHPVSR
uniref:Putative secreted peptide n=1 Tax=Anopheles braziliensis TaxID=58242 RepID=A0A2M3ZNL3_9DIPT